MKTIWEADVTTAADLLKALTALAEQGHDLHSIYLLDQGGEEIPGVRLVETMLTDGSTTNDLRFG